MASQSQEALVSPDHVNSSPPRADTHEQTDNVSEPRAQDETGESHSSHLENENEPESTADADHHGEQHDSQTPANVEHTEHDETNCPASKELVGLKEAMKRLEDENKDLIENVTRLSLQLCSIDPRTLDRSKITEIGSNFSNSSHPSPQVPAAAPATSVASTPPKKKRFF
jgi:hypothetical protein